MGDKKMTELEIEALTDWLIRHGHNKIEADDCIQTVLSENKLSNNTGVEAADNQKESAEDLARLVQSVEELRRMDRTVHSPLSAILVKAGEATLQEAIQEMLD